MKSIKKGIIVVSIVVAMSMLSGCSIGETWDVLWGHNEVSSEDGVTPVVTYDPTAVTVDESVSAPKFTTDLDSTVTYAPNEEAADLVVETSEEAEGEVTYQWYKNSVDSNGGGEQINGATSNTYKPDTSNEGRTYYFVVATHTVDNKINLATSMLAEVIVDPDALPSVQALKQPGWVETENGWIFNNEEGQPQTGWIQDGDNWHFMGEDGMMKTGWIEDGGNWYLLSDNGIMQKGWYQGDDKWYFFGNDGILKTGMVTDGDKKYSFNSDGTLKKSDWTQADGKWYYSTADGSLAVGWEEISGSWYYFSPEGVMRYDTEIEGKWLNPDGKLAH